MTLGKCSCGIDAVILTGGENIIHKNEFGQVTGVTILSYMPKCWACHIKQLSILTRQINQRGK